MLQFTFFGVLYYRAKEYSIRFANIQEDVFPFRWKFREDVVQRGSEVVVTFRKETSVLLCPKGL